MWSSKGKVNQRAALVESGYLETGRTRQDGGKCSCAAAVILGILLALEIMAAGSMLFHIDIRETDCISLFFTFLVLFFAMVAILTDR